MQRVVSQKFSPEPSGWISNQVFVPSDRDGGRLSVARGSLSEPHETALRFARGDSNNLPPSVVGVTTAEAHGVGTLPYPDPLRDDFVHAILSFATTLDQDQIEDLALELRLIAEDHGLLWSRP